MKTARYILVFLLLLTITVLIKHSIPKEEERFVKVIPTNEELKPACEAAIIVSTKEALREYEKCNKIYEEKLDKFNKEFSKLDDQNKKLRIEEFNQLSRCIKPKTVYEGTHYFYMVQICMELVEKIKINYL